MLKTEILQTTPGMFGGRLVPLFCGGATRAQSVMHGLEHMRAEVRVDDWVFVHTRRAPV